MCSAETKSKSLYRSLCAVVEKVGTVVQFAVHLYGVLCKVNNRVRYSRENTLGQTGDLSVVVSIENRKTETRKM